MDILIIMDGEAKMYVYQEDKALGMVINENNFIHRRTNKQIIDIPSDDLPSQIQFKMICNNRNYLEVQKKITLEVKWIS